MTGWEGNAHEEAFWNADLDDAGERVAGVLREEQADVLSIYDWHGLYGHPDHVQVHRVGCRAAELARDRLPGLRVVETTMNRDEMRRGVERMREAGVSGIDVDEFDVDGQADDGNPMGTPETELTLGVDVREWAARKRASISAHRSQVTDSGFFLQMPDDAFAEAFGTEWFIEQDREPGNPRIGWLFET
jgi:LmbE family N-acetylglucosaminyl deacetylase